MVFDCQFGRREALCLSIGDEQCCLGLASPAWQQLIATGKGELELQRLVSSRHSRDIVPHVNCGINIWIEPTQIGSTLGVDLIRHLYCCEGQDKTHQQPQAEPTDSS